MNQRTAATDLAGLGIALACGLGLLALVALPHVTTVLVTMRSHFVLSIFDGRTVFGTSTAWDVLRFVVTVLLMHVGFAVWVWWVARGLHRWRAAGQRATWVVGCFVLWTLTLLFANAGLYSWSATAQSFWQPARQPLGPLAFWEWLVIAVGLTALPALGEAARWFRARPRTALAAVTTFAAVTVVLAWPTGRSAHAAATASRPNIIFVGLDSLRLANSGAFGGKDTPSIDAWLADAFAFNQVYSPLPRTFGAWMTILTGQEPVTHRARFNLMPPEMFDRSGTIADDLRAAGYRTVYATDEVRFSNIDASYGFDQIIGPPMGASDFILSWTSDLPLVNLVINTAPGRFLFPATHGNRAAAKIYRPESFDAVLWDELEVPVDGPLFLSVHFTMPHWPTHWADAPMTYEYVVRPDVTERVLMHAELYAAALRAGDAQVGRFLAEAERRGLLDNAIVVMLSDHGEALGLPEEVSLRALRTADTTNIQSLAVRTGSGGHGTSSLMPMQYRCLLAFRRYGGEVWRGSTVLPASLVDIAPTVRELADVAGTRKPDGLSLAALLRGEPPAAAQQQRIFFTETEFNPRALLKNDLPDERQALVEGAPFYRVDLDTGRIMFREERMAELVHMKERAALRPPWILATIPTPDGATWLIANMSTGEWGRYPEDLANLPGAPGAALERALREHFGAETPPLAPWPEALIVTKTAGASP